MCYKDEFYNGSGRLVKDEVLFCDPHRPRLCDVPEVRKHYTSSKSEPRYLGHLPTHLPPTPRESKEPSPAGKRDLVYIPGTRSSETSRPSRHHDDHPNYKYASSPDSKPKSDVYTRPTVVVTQNYNVSSEVPRYDRDRSPGRGHSGHYKKHSKHDSGFEYVTTAEEDRQQKRDRRRAEKPSDDTDKYSTIATAGARTSYPPRTNENSIRYGSSPNGPSSMGTMMHRRNSVSSRNDDTSRASRPRVVSTGSRSRASSATGVRFADDIESRKKQQNAEIASRTNKPNTEQVGELKGILKKPAGTRADSNERSKDRSTKDKGKGVEVDLTVEELRRSVESLGLRGATKDRNVERDSNVSSSYTGSSMPDMDYDKLRKRFERDNGGSTGRIGSNGVTRNGDRYNYY